MGLAKASKTKRDHLPFSLLFAAIFLKGSKKFPHCQSTDLPIQSQIERLSKKDTRQGDASLNFSRFTSIWACRVSSGKRYPRQEERTK